MLTEETDHLGYTKDMQQAIQHAQHILESAGLTVEGFDSVDVEHDGAYRICISNQLEETGDEPPYTEPKILTVEIYDGTFERIVGLPTGYKTKVKQVGNE